MPNKKNNKVWIVSQSGYNEAVIIIAVYNNKKGMEDHLEHEFNQSQESIKIHTSYKEWKEDFQKNQEICCDKECNNPVEYFVWYYNFFYRLCEFHLNSYFPIEERQKHNIRINSL